MNYSNAKKLNKAFSALYDEVVDMHDFGTEMAFIEAVIKFRTQINKDFVSNEHRCPRCNKLTTDWEEVEFIEQAGECISCDHVRGDVVDSFNQFLKEEA